MPEDITYHSVELGQETAGGNVLGALVATGVVVDGGGGPDVVRIVVVVVVLKVVTVSTGDDVGGVTVIGVGQPTRIENVRL